MQKKLIALAIAGLASTAAFAQTNVTIYGVMDLSLETVKTAGSAAGTDTLNTQKVSSNSSLIGFKGTEDLGDGLSAIFQIETNLSPDAGASIVGSTRDTFVGLKGATWGMVQAGTLTGPTRNLAATVEFSPGWTTNAITSALTGAIGGVGTGADSRMTNAILYTTPAYGAFTFQAGYGAGEAHTNTVLGNQNARNWTLGATYADGPLYVGYAYLDSLDSATGAASTLLGAGFGDTKVHKLGAKYAFASGTTVSALFDRTKVEDGSTTALGDITRNAWMLGVNQSFGVQNVWLQYAKANELTGSACAVGCSGTDAKQITLGWSYTMSKRTMLHAYYTKITNEVNSVFTSYDFALNAAGITTPGDGASPSSLGFGLRHAF